MNSNEKFRVAILGPRGIGQVHARILNSLGVQICAVLASSAKSAEIASLNLQKLFGIHAKSFCNFDELLEDCGPDAVHICTPPHLHFENILTAFNSNMPVFCEKPLFWEKDLNEDEFENKLSALMIHPNRYCMVNTSNVYFIDRIIEEFGVQNDIQSFYFEFFTRGNYVGRDIAFDLLPHGLSLVYRLMGPGQINKLKEEFSQNSYNCFFKYGECDITFNFQEKSDGPKTFVFRINDRIFRRIQEGSGKTYRVFLLDSITGKKIPVQDPFHVYIKSFLHYCTEQKSKLIDEFENAAVNFESMAKILFLDSAVL